MQIVVAERIVNAVQGGIVTAPDRTWWWHGLREYGDQGGIGRVVQCRDSHHVHWLLFALESDEPGTGPRIQRERTLALGGDHRQLAVAVGHDGMDAGAARASAERR